MSTKYALKHIFNQKFIDKRHVLQYNYSIGSAEIDRSRAEILKNRRRMYVYIYFRMLQTRLRAGHKRLIDTCLYKGIVNV